MRIARKLKEMSIFRGMLSIDIEHILLIGSILLLLSIFVSKASGILSVPLLILFLGIGMLAGADGPGGIHFNDPRLAQAVGVVSLIFILFSGGLDTRWESVKPIFYSGLSLSTAGVVVTALAVGLFVTAVSDFSLTEGLLLGAIVSSTDAAAVFSILRSNGIGLRRNVKPLLELESGSNDSMAYFLTIALTSLLSQPDLKITTLLIMLVKQMVLGGLLGFVMGKAMLWLINSIKLGTEGLYPVMVVGMAFFTYGATAFIGGNGFLAIYIAGVILGSNDFIHKRSILKFYDGQAWLVQIIMFLTLGLLVYPKNLLNIAGIGIAISLFLILVARPLGVFASLIGYKSTIREKIFVSWVGLRGAVPIIFATYPLIAGVSKAPKIFDIVFFIVLTSVTLQGTTLAWLAKKLNLYVPEIRKRKLLLKLDLDENMKNELFEAEVGEASNVVGKSIVQLHFPPNSLIVLIKRQGEFVTPNGKTELKSGDKLMIMSDKGDVDRIREVLDIKPE